MTVLKALALAEDTKSTAQKSKAVIIRKNSQEKNGREEIAVNLNIAGLCMRGSGARPCQYVLKFTAISSRPFFSCEFFRMNHRFGFLGGRFRVLRKRKCLQDSHFLFATP